MAAPPPPPPPPPPAPGPIAKPNNAKLLDSIRAGTGLKKVPDAEKNDRSTTIVPTKPGGNTTAIPLPQGLRGNAGGVPNLADAIKARKQAMAKGPQSNFPPPAVTPAKKIGAPPPNQNVNSINSIPKPPSQNSKPSTENGEINAFPPPPSPHVQCNMSFPPPPFSGAASNKPLAPPPMVSVPPNKALAPPPMVSVPPNKPFAPPPSLPGNMNKPLAPPPMVPANITKPLAPPPVPLNTNSLPPPPLQKDLTSHPPPVFYSMKPMINDSMRQTNIPYTSIPNAIKTTPPQFAPPPPPPTSSMPTKSLLMLGKSMTGSNGNISTIDGSQNKPPLPVRMETTSNFDSRFTFANESTFPDPSIVSNKRSKRVV